MKKITKLTLVLLLLIGAMLTVSCEKSTDPEGTGVTVSPASTIVTAGTTQQFTAVVNGDDNPPQTVSWTVTGGNDSTINSTSGLLTVGLAETAPTLTVTATSTADNTKYGTATARVQRVSEFVGMHNAITWTLKVTETLPNRYDPKQSDLYSLTYTGGPTSTGLVQNRVSNTLTLKPNNSNTTFTAVLDGTELAAVDGTITWSDNTTSPGPGPLTPGTEVLNRWFVSLDEGDAATPTETYANVEITVANEYATVPNVSVRVGTTDYTLDEAWHNVSTSTGNHTYGWLFYHASLLTPGATVAITLTVDGTPTVGNVSVAYPAVITGPATFIHNQPTNCTWTLTQDCNIQGIDMQYTTTTGGFGYMSEDLLPTARSFTIPANTVPAANWDWAGFGIYEINHVAVGTTTFASMSYKYRDYFATPLSPQPSQRKLDRSAVKRMVMGE